MKQVYTKNDINFMNWEEFGEIIGKLGDKILQFSEKNNIKFDLLVPVLRSGGIPATVLGNKLNIINILPIQFKYKNGEIKQILSLPKVLNKNNFVNILICETNTVTGKTANNVIRIIKKEYPNSNIYYSTVTKVFGLSNEIKGIKKEFFGIKTDECFIASKKEILDYGLRKKITIFPWENIENELLAING